jgi:hypothetical protein
MNPRFGQVTGGDSVTFTGTGFSATTSTYTILIDNRPCSVTAASTTSVTCTTANRPGLFPNPTLSIYISGVGSVSTHDLIFRYCNFWSNTVTWGGEFAPMEGESVYVPAGLHLLVDVDFTPVLQAVLVEGSLIFAPSTNPNHERTFDAHYIMVNAGYMEVGTEEFPYTSKLIITMHSNKLSPELPIFGNKVLAVKNGHLELHGNTRVPTWTSLKTTASIGATTITLMVAVDWKAGEVIVIAPTGYDNLEAEERTIVSINNANPSSPIITLDSPLKFQHYAAIETYGSDTIEMRAEVGLLTRNVVY